MTKHVTSLSTLLNVIVKSCYPKQSAGHANLLPPCATHSTRIMKRLRYAQTCRKARRGLFETSPTDSASRMRCRCLEREEGRRVPRPHRRKRARRRARRHVRRPRQGPSCGRHPRTFPGSRLERPIARVATGVLSRTTVSALRCLPMHRRTSTLASSGPADFLCGSSRRTGRRERDCPGILSGRVLASRRSGSDGAREEVGRDQTGLPARILGTCDEIRDRPRRESKSRAQIHRSLPPGFAVSSVLSGAGPNAET
jgi:hypothetical protein